MFGIIILRYSAEVLVNFKKDRGTYVRWTKHERTNIAAFLTLSELKNSIVCNISPRDRVIVCSVFLVVIQANCLHAWNTAPKQPDYISDNLPYRGLHWKRIGYNMFHSQLF